MEASNAAIAVPGVKQVLADYVTLTKPRVQLLLLLTTITTMYVAGDPSLTLVALTVIGGSLSRGRRGARSTTTTTATSTRRWAARARGPCPRGGSRPRAALIYAFALQIASFALLAGAVNLLSACLAAGRVRLVHARLHRLAQAPLAAEHRHRRRGRRDPAARRLGGGDRERRARRAVPVRDRLLLDAAALLGAEPAHEGRVRARRRADDAGRPRRGRRRAARSSSTRSC